MFQLTIPSLLGILTFFLGVPAVTLTLCAFPRLLRPAVGLMVFATCYIKKPFYMEVFYQFYRGVDRGYGVTIPDLLFFGIAFYLLIRRPYRLVWWPYNAGLWILLIAISIVSLYGAGVPAYGWFSIHKLVRCLVLYWVMVNVVRTRRDIVLVIQAFVLAMIWQGTVVLWDKYVTGHVVNRAMGSFNHPNAMAMYLDLILPIVWCALLEGVLPRRWRKAALVAVGLAFIAVLFTKSRAAIVLMPAMMLGVTFLSATRQVTYRKLGLIATAAAAGMLVFAMAMPRIIARFQKAPKESAETRTYFNEAAAAMARDRWFGCGLNLYSWTLENTDYYWYVYPDRVDEPDPEAFRESALGKSRLGTAHHIYYLFLGETGWPGAIVFVVFLLRFYGKAVVGFFRARDPVCRAVLTGMVGGLALLYLHGVLEWVFRQTQTLYLFFATTGLLMATLRIERQPDSHE